MAGGWPAQAQCNTPVARSSSATNAVAIRVGMFAAQRGIGDCQHLSRFWKDLGGQP